MAPSGTPPVELDSPPSLELAPPLLSAAVVLLAVVDAVDDAVVVAVVAVLSPLAALVLPPEDPSPTASPSLPHAPTSTSHEQMPSHFEEHCGSVTKLLSHAIVSVDKLRSVTTVTTCHPRRGPHGNACGHRRSSSATHGTVTTHAISAILTAMRRTLPLLVMLACACGHRRDERPDDAIVHTDRIGYTQAYWHRQLVAADFVRPGVKVSEIIPDGAVLVDLTHAFAEDTVVWPSESRGFTLQQIEHGRTDAGFYYESNRISTPEHAGTHLDAPRHFAQGKDGVDTLPLSRLMGPAVVIDISGKAAADRDAQLERADVEAFERNNGRIDPGTIVLVRTGWDTRWPDRLRYLGDTRPGATDKLHFPGIAESAANLLISRQVGAVGIDTASVDHGPSKDFKTHRAFADAGLPTFENVARLDQLPVRGAVVLALPMKVAHASGAPLRVVAIMPQPVTR